MLKELYTLTKLFRNFIVWIKSLTITGLYGALWEVLLAIELMVSEYKKFATQYLALALHNQYGEIEGEDSDMESNYILLCINNAFAKLMKYQEFLSHFPAYTTAVVMNPTLCWQWMKSKVPHLLESSQTTVFRLWEKDYNSKVLPKPAITIAAEIRASNKASSFDNFLQVEEDTDLFNAIAPIDMYQNYCTTHFTFFSKYSDIVIWWESYSIADDPVFQIAWNMITIPIMSSECKREFSIAGQLVTILGNYLKEDIIEASEYLDACYKQKSAKQSDQM